jgi:D-tyrosyl-tRNA(Tyr) deacylase
MRALIQRVKWAKVEVDGRVVGKIGPGILTLFGVGATDTDADVERLVGKILKLRIFEDEAGKMNLSLLDRGYAHLIVSQFTLYGDTSKGNRPSFVAAGKPDLAERLYEKAIAVSKAQGVKTEGGKFQAHMEVSLLNDGPVTFWLE